MLKLKSLFISEEKNPANMHATTGESQSMEGFSVNFTKAAQKTKAKI
jgi:hypothetical protein